MSTTTTIEFVESVKEYIFNTAYTLFKQNQEQYQDQYQLYSENTWESIFEKIKNQIQFYSDISMKEESNIEIAIYKKESYNEYIARIGDLKRLGPYDYIDFYNKMKNPEFNKCIKRTYEKSEKIKKIKQEIIIYILGIEGHIHVQIQPIELINIIPVCEYISNNNISLDEEPMNKHFRSNKQEFCKMYTLWNMINI